MRRSPIRDLLAARGAQFELRAGVEVPMRFSSYEEEYRAVRDAVGLTDFSFTGRFSAPESGLDVLERYAAGSVANIRFGRVLHTFAANSDGMLEADLYIANDDDKLLVIGESIVDDAATWTELGRLGATDAGIEDVAAETALFGLDGYKAWAVAKALFGSDVLGLPYLSLETYELEGVQVKLLRAGKTSEFGYLLLVPVGAAASVWEQIESAGKEHGLKPVGLDAHLGLRLDGRFFNIHEEGAKVRDPLPLGLQWMIDLRGDDFRGKEAICARRSAGLKKKIIGVVGEDGAPLAVGEKISHDGEVLAEIAAAKWSFALGKHIALALFDIEYAYSGLLLRGQEGKRIRTVSMPPFTPKSLTVKLDEM